MSTAVTSTGMKMAKLVCVLGDADTNSNKYYNLVQISGSEFRATWGRVGGTEATQVYPMSKWDSIYRDKTNPKKKPKPYTDVTELYEEVAVAAKDKGSLPEVIRSTRHDLVRDVIKRLLAHANKSIAANYTVSSEAVSLKQVERAQSMLDAISVGGYSPSRAKEINDHFLEFFTVVPRKMKDVRDHLLKLDDTTGNAKLFGEIMKNEQDTLDVMAGQVSMNAKDDKAVTSGNQDTLDLIGLDCEPVTDPKELDMIRAAMQGKRGMLKHAFKVKNAKTHSAYDKHFGGAANKKNELFWHGSRSENWINILSKGLLIRPSGAAYTGSAFGDGIYFANEFDKSLGYTSISSSRWAGGSSSNAFLSLYRVHTGNQYVTQRSDGALSLDKLKHLGNYDSTHAKKGGFLVRDEYVVYQPCQCTVEYLVEVVGSQH
jgi:poly [ADP-ribose] polymerase 2/3/4